MSNFRERAKTIVHECRPIVYDGGNFRSEMQGPGWVSAIEQALLLTWNEAVEMAEKKLAEAPLSSREAHIVEIRSLRQEVGGK